MTTRLKASKRILILKAPGSSDIQGDELSSLPCQVCVIDKTARRIGFWSNEADKSMSSEAGGSRLDDVYLRRVSIIASMTASIIYSEARERPVDRSRMAYKSPTGLAAKYRECLPCD